MTNFGWSRLSEGSNARAEFEELVVIIPMHKMEGQSGNSGHETHLYRIARCGLVIGSLQRNSVK